MDLDRGLLASSIREPNGFNVLQKVPEKMIEGDAVHAYRFMISYFLQYSKMPGYQLILDQTGIDLFRGVNLQEPSIFFIDQIKARYFWNRGKEATQGLIKLLDAQAGVTQMREAVSKMLFDDLYDQDANDTIPRSIFHDPSHLLNDYDRAKRFGVTGIPTPWVTMNRMTMGYQKEDLILYAARPGSGKTWLLLINLLHAWELGHKVMLFSTEMSQLALKRRVMALASRLPYTMIRAGRLDPGQFEEYRDYIQGNINDDRFLLVGNDTTLKRSTIEQNIIMKRPELVAVDGWYMVEDDIEKPSRDEKDKHIWKVAKKIPKKYGLPFLVSHQLNRPDRNQKAGQKPDLARLSQSDASGQYSDFVFAIYQTQEMHNDKTLGLIPIKTRDSEKKDAIEIRWDLNNCLYNEIDREVQTVESGEVVDFRNPQEPGDIPF